VEVKTSIPVLGELLRQLSAYKEFIRLTENPLGDIFIVVAPSEQHERIIIEQGYRFYKYNDPTKLF